MWTCVWCPQKAPTQFVPVVSRVEREEGGVVVQFCVPSADARGLWGALLRSLFPSSLELNARRGGGSVQFSIPSGDRNKPSGTFVRGLSPRRAYGMEHSGRGTRSPDLDASGSGALLRRVAAVRIATNFARE